MYTTVCSCCTADYFRCFEILGCSMGNAMILHLCYIIDEEMGLNMES